MWLFQTKATKEVKIECLRILYVILSKSLALFMDQVGVCIDGPKHWCGWIEGRWGWAQVSVRWKMLPSGRDWSA
jgi:hypothetical protein